MIYVYILIGIAVVLVGFIALVASRPAEFRIQRSATMTAPPATVFAQVDDLHLWQAWSPWEKLDPNMKRTYNGAPSGIGAIYSWAGDKNVGEGRMTIIESKPDELIRIKLEFLKPWTATNISVFSFQPSGSQTHVNWSMTGRNNFMAKAFCMIINMDKLIGRDFEKGLANLKSLVETTSP